MGVKIRISQEKAVAAKLPFLYIESLKIKTKQKEVTDPIPACNLSRCLEPMWGFERYTCCARIVTLPV